MHTKGPWTVGVSGYNGIHCVDARSKTGTIEICEVWGTGDDKIENDECRANAHLISAAPDLLDALDGAIKAYDYVSTQNARFSDPQWVIFGRRAIAKAKGTTNE